MVGSIAVGDVGLTPVMEKGVSIFLAGEECIVIEPIVVWEKLGCAENGLGSFVAALKDVGESVSGTGSSSFKVQVHL